MPKRIDRVKRNRRVIYRFFSLGSTMPERVPVPSAVAEQMIKEGLSLLEGVAWEGRDDTYYAHPEAIGPYLEK